MAHPCHAFIHEDVSAEASHDHHTARIDIDRLHAFVYRFIGDLGTALHLSTVLVGDRLGLYAAMVLR